MAVSAAVGYARLAAPHALPLPHAVVGTRRESNRRAGRLSYFVRAIPTEVVLHPQAALVGAARALQTLEAAR